MIDLHTLSQVDNKPSETHWQNEIVVEIDHQRGPIASYSRTTVKNKGDCEPGPVCNHHVPYSRIAWGIFEITGGRPCGYVYGFFNPLLDKDHFGNQKLVESLKEPTSFYEFKKWFNLMFTTITDWPENLFTGPSSGDDSGKAIDNPIGDKKNIKYQHLLTRLQGARLRLHNALHISTEVEAPDFGKGVFHSKGEYIDTVHFSAKP